ncbi:D-arabinono-1,4-lactone oxidase [Nocardioides solisilvae]|uniref:D-arabinono-1,4-lactone oxidase n=1 Tax=Nocardioides solisilvae TaxID=1542435 RepID=UPI000D741B7C|nr:D-arabinono-1,4-lactone oxidase [Nocardioides solisilvae]
MPAARSDTGTGSTGSTGSTGGSGSDNAPATWTSWSGLEAARPDRVLAPESTEDVVAAVLAAREAGSTVKMVGTGHSFTGIGVPGRTMLRPDRLRGVLSVDRDAMTVTAYAGTRLADLNLELERLGLSLHNMGDIAEQTLAGAVSTGTHGSGGLAAGLAAQLEGFEMVAGTGEVLVADRTSHPDLLDLGRIGLGALGVLTTVTFRVEPLFLLQAEERPIGWDELLATHDELVATHHHVDVHWFPHTDGALLKANTRLADDVAERRPLAAWQRRLDDDLLSNRLFGVLTALGSRVPAVVPTVNRVASRALSARSYSDVAHRVFVSSRQVRFREMEYAVPREAGLAVLREARRVIDAHDWRIGFPVEVRTAPADDVPLSTAYGRDVCYLAFHVPHTVDHRPYFDAVERVLRAHDGRPHWGKLHGLGAPDLARVHPRFEEFRALRDRLDPDRVLVNAHLRHVLGP